MLVFSYVSADFVKVGAVPALGLGVKITNQCIFNQPGSDYKANIVLNIFIWKRHKYSMDLNSSLSIDPQSAPESVLRADVLSLYLQLLTAEFMEQALRKEKVRQNNRLYNPLVAIWLMVFQRLHGNVSMERAVANVVHGLPDAFWPRPCKRRRENQVSGNDGSYNAARQELPKGVNVLSTLAPVGRDVGSGSSERTSLVRVVAARRRTGRINHGRRHQFWSVYGGLCRRSGQAPCGALNECAFNSCATGAARTGRSRRTVNKWHRPGSGVAAEPR